MFLDPDLMGQHGRSAEWGLGELLESLGPHLPQQIKIVAEIVMVFYCLPRLAAEFIPKPAVLCQSFQCLTERDRICGWDQNTIHAVVNQLRDGCDRGADGRVRRVP